VQVNKIILEFFLQEFERFRKQYCC